jgi:phage baseplate assembly protein V
MAEPGSVLRVGYVSDFDPVRKYARVMFPDKDRLVSGWLQLLVINTLKNKDEANLDVGERVACLMMGNGIEHGVVLGALWDDKNDPPAGDQDVRITTYEDGTTVQVDRKNHVVEIKDHYGSFIRFADGNIYIKAAANVYINE